MEKFGSSQGIQRVEDARFLTGHGHYIADATPPGTSHALVYRSPVAHAEIVRIDTQACAAMPGVLLVVTGADWAKAGYGPIPTKSAIQTFKDGSPFKQPRFHCLAIDRVRYVGEPVALVVAETAAQARDAIEHIDVEFVDLPPVTDIEAAIAPDAPQIWDDAPGNVCLDFELGDEAATAAAFETADHVITLRVRNNRLSPTPLEPRGAIASFDAQTGRFSLQQSSQNIHANRDLLANDILHIEPANLHHFAPDIGGGFGGKNSLYQEPALILHAARELGRPVKWLNDRSESFLSDTHGRDQVATLQLALDADGRFRALRVDVAGNLGAYVGTFGPFVPTAGAARTQGGPYDFPHIFYTAKAVFTNTAVVDPYRGAGRPEATHQLERLIEYAARRLGFDPVELRRRNLVAASALPRKSALGLEIDSGNFPLVFARCLEISDRAGFAARAAQSRSRGCLRGFAIAPYLECSGGMPKEFAGVEFVSDGRVRLSVGTHSTGMGHETSFAQILASELGIDIARIDFVQGDTEATPVGGGHGGSRSLETGGSAVLEVARAVRQQALRVAAHLINSTPSDLEFSAGKFIDLRTQQSVSMDEVIIAAQTPGRLPPDLEQGCLNQTSVHQRDGITVPNGCHAVETEVDPETGDITVDHYWAVDDFGAIVNSQLAAGQAMGGIVQGLGQALMEEITYDPASGQLLSGSLMDYALPRAVDVPALKIEFYEGAPTGKNPLGVKGAGEAGCCPSCPAIVNAVLDALREHGVDDISMPLTSAKVWQAIADAKSRA